jgi:hypothetical protein
LNIDFPDARLTCDPRIARANYFTQFSRLYSMLGSDKSRGYCLEMICADFLAGAHLDDVSPDALAMSLKSLIAFLPQERRAELMKRL